ncbi:MAG: hypothetical protein ACAF41_01975 [Leptolyngbya sp. BL-A-14]
MLRSIERYAASRHYPLQSVWAEVILSMTHWLVAHAQGKRPTDIASMKPVLAQLQRVEGSHAQRQVFQQLYQHQHTASLNPSQS